MLHVVTPPPAPRHHQQPPGAAGAIALLALACLVSACQAQPVAQRPVAMRDLASASDADLQQWIVQGIGPAACQADAECRTLPVGTKACGGPARWLAWSASVSDGAQLQAWSDALAERQRQQQQARGQASTCSVVPDPGAACVMGRCTLQGSGQGGRSGPSAR